VGWAKLTSNSSNRYITTRYV